MISRECLVDADVPKVVVEEPEAGGRVDEERVEKRALALRVLGGPREPVAQSAHGDRGRDERPGAEDPDLGGLCRRVRPAECQSPESDDDENLDERLPATEVERHEDDDTEIERRVSLSGRLEEGDLGDDQRRGERHQPVRRAGKPLVEADERESEQRREAATAASTGAPRSPTAAAAASASEPWIEKQIAAARAAASARRASAGS